MGTQTLRHSFAYTLWSVLLVFALLVVWFGSASAFDHKTLRIGVAGRVPSLGNPFGSVVTGGVHPSELTFDTLIQLGPSGRIDPALAESWEATNPTRWVFTLRRDVVFSNGEPFDAHAVVAEINYLKTAEAQKYFLSAETRLFKSVRALDDYTFELITTVPDAILPKRLALFLMVPPKAWAEMGPDEFGLTPIGTGPFNLVDWGMATGKYVLERNPTSWRSPRDLQRVEFYLLAEQTSRTQALMSDQIDLAYQVGFEDMEDLEAMGFQIFTRLGTQVGGLCLPNIYEDSPLYDQRVRLALNHAVNRYEISEFIFKGVTPPVSQGAIPGVFGYHPGLEPYEYDLNKARELLADAGYPDGLTLEAKVLIQGLPEQAVMYQKVAQDLAQIGVIVNFRSVLGPEWIRIWFSGDWEGADIISCTHGSSAYVDVIRGIENFSCKKRGTFFCRPDMLETINASNVNFDPAARERQLQDMMAELKQLAPTILLFPQTHIFAMTARVQNVTFLRERMQLDQVVLAD